MTDPNSLPLVASVPVNSPASVAPPTIPIPVVPFPPIQPMVTDAASAVAVSSPQQGVIIPIQNQPVPVTSVPAVNVVPVAPPVVPPTVAAPVAISPILAPQPAPSPSTLSPTPTVPAATPAAPLVEMDLV